MKMYILSGISIFCLLWYGCGDASDFSMNEVPAVKYDQEIAIRVHHAVATIDRKYVIQFDSVLTDSRCPDGLMCFWSGVAGIRLIISEDSGMNKSVELYTLNNINWSDSVVYQDLKIKLKALNPYPSIYKQFDNKSYKATLILSKTK